MRTPILAGALLALSALAAAPAHAGGELSLQLASTVSHDPDLDLFSDANNVASYGLRGGWFFHENMALVADLHRGRSIVDAYGTTTATEDYGDELVFRSSLTTHQVGLGFKGRTELWRPAFAMYGVAEGVLAMSTARFDDDPDEEGNPNELSFRAAAPGFRTALGLEWLPLRVGLDQRLFTHLEAGYAFLGALDFEDDQTTGGPMALGDLRVRGFYINWGVGLRF